jgi:hypothetical protein
MFRVGNHNINVVECDGTRGLRYKSSWRLVGVHRRRARVHQQRIYPPKAQSPKSSSQLESAIKDRLVCHGLSTAGNDDHLRE